MLRKIISHTPALILLVLICLVTARAGDDVPAWLRQAAANNPTVTDKDAKAVVLHDETRVTVGDDGRVMTVTTQAVRILSREGRGEAVAATVYNTETEKVKEMQAWMIRPSGQVIKYGKDRMVDAIASDDDIYDEARRRVISGRDDAEPGSVFGFEIVQETKEVFSQFDWAFGGDQPVVASRISVTVPAGWRAEGTVFNHSKIEPAVSGSTYTWEARDLEAIRHEPASPSGANLVARISVRVFPPAGRSAGMLRTFETWPDVSRFISELSDPQVQLDDALAGKARELIAEAKTEFEKIQAIGRYAQNIKYVSIQIGVGRGGGIRPHSSLEVFRKSYGDCKDKANLMRAMLRAVGITAYPVGIYSGDPTYVRAELPSPNQFNHCIIAIKVSDAVQVPTIITHPKLGRLMIFDPTDVYTPVGDLPWYLQGSQALVVAGADGDLLKMPVTPPEANRLERQSEVTLTPEGSITAVVHERAAGQSAAAFRHEFRRKSQPDYMKMIERWVTSGATGAKVIKVEPSDNNVEGKFGLDVEFTVPNYAQSMRGKLLVFKPAVVFRREQVVLIGPKRKYPVVLKSEAYSETVRVKLPEGFEVDEIPDATRLDAPFGKYSASWEVKEGYLIFTRSCVIQATTIPAEQYLLVRVFFDRMRGAELAPVVLAKK